MSITVMEVNLGADLAELYNTYDTSIVPGEIVSINPGLHAGVQKSDRAYDPMTFGIVSTRPSYLMGAGEKVDGANAVAVALAGRVPVKVNTENGPIEPGDFIAPSSSPGVGMRASRPGLVVGQAMTPFSGEGEGTVLVYVGRTWYTPPLVDGNDLQNILQIDHLGLNNVNVEGDLTVKGDATFQGRVAVKDIEITGHVTVSSDVAGTAVIPAGQTFIDVTFSTPHATIPKITTGVDDFIPVKVENKSVNGFRLSIPEAKPNDVSIDWVALEVK